MYAKIIADRIYRRLDNIETGALTITAPDGRVRDFAGRHAGAKAHIRIHDWRVFSNLARKGNIGLAEDYRNGAWETDDLVGVLDFGMANAPVLRRVITGDIFARFAARLGYLLRRNTIRGSRKNIHAHYDLGNAFYALWLDPSMTYSSALYANENESLQSAQANKYDRIIGRLNRASGSLLEIGCGWGGFAARASAKGDFGIKGITLSQEQHAYATARVKNTGAHIALEDYRHQQGKFDHIVSIEMFEAVGEKFWKTYFGKIAALLKKDGRAVVQTITMNEVDFPAYRKRGDFIRSYIFPGGLLPSESRFRDEAAAAGLVCGDTFRFGQDYARTLGAWLDAFDGARERILALGFDEGFIRLWRFYLAGCIAGFRNRTTDVMQIELAHE